MEKWVALISGIVGILTILAKYLWDRYKSKPKNKRLTYVEKRVQEVKNKLAKDAARGNLFGISTTASESYDKLQQARRLSSSASRKNSGKAD